MIRLSRGVAKTDTENFVQIALLFSCLRLHTTSLRSQVRGIELAVLRSSNVFEIHRSLHAERTCQCKVKH